MNLHNLHISKDSGRFGNTYHAFERANTACRFSIHGRSMWRTRKEGDIVNNEVKQPLERKAKIFPRRHQGYTVGVCLVRGLTIRKFRLKDNVISLNFRLVPGREQP